MKNVRSIAFHPGSREELLPDFDKNFPYIASRAEIDKYVGRSVPWHWHKAVEQRSSVNTPVSLPQSIDKTGGILISSVVIHQR